MNVVPTFGANMLCLHWHKFAKYFSILHGVKNKTTLLVSTHSIASVNLHPSIGVNGMFEYLSDHAIYDDWGSDF